MRVKKNFRELVPGNRFFWGNEEYLKFDEDYFCNVDGIYAIHLKSGRPCNFDHMVDPSNVEIEVELKTKKVCFDEIKPGEKFYWNGLNYWKFGRVKESLIEYAGEDGHVIGMGMDVEVEVEDLS